MKISEIILLLSCVLVHNYGYADVSHGVLEKYKQNDIFVCVGIYSCVSLARAINAKYAELLGIDESQVLVDHARAIFPKDFNRTITNYHIYHGGMSEFRNIIFTINKPMTIFLGNHFPSIDEVRSNTILQELDVLKEHPVKTHTVLIDYVNYAGTDAFGGVSLNEIKSRLLEINGNYRFSLEKGGRLEKEEKAILVAYVS